MIDIFQNKTDVKAHVSIGYRVQGVLTLPCPRLTTFRGDVAVSHVFIQKVLFPSFPTYGVETCQLVVTGTSWRVDQTDTSSRSAIRGRRLCLCYVRFVFFVLFLLEPFFFCPSLWLTQSLLILSFIFVYFLILIYSYYHYFSTFSLQYPRFSSRWRSKL